MIIGRRGEQGMHHTKSNSSKGCAKGTGSPPAAKGKGRVGTSTKRTFERNGRSVSKCIGLKEQPNDDTVV